MSDIDSDAPADSFEIVPKDESDSSGSFLSILDEKNRLIENLKHQIANQKLQIMYYMKKELNCNKLAELSHTCSPEYLEESLPVVLSLENYRKENGLKSNLLRLYEYMESLDVRLSKSLNCQEYILRKIIEKLCNAMKDPVSITLRQPIEQNICLDLFTNLLDATVSLRKKLESFRICCNRLIIVEDERNNLVEQVVTLPAEEKFNCNFLINIKQDKIELEKKIKSLTHKQHVQEREIKELNFIEKKLSKLQKELNTSVNNSGDFSSVGEMVRNLNYEAKYLLQVTKKHQGKCQVNKSPNFNNIILSVKSAFRGGEINVNEFNKDELEIINVIKKEIEEFKWKTKNDAEKIQSDEDGMKNSLNETLIEKNKLKIANIHLQNYIQKLQKNYNSEILLLKQQRDNFEAQVDDLEELRKSYTELIIMPNSDSSNKEKEMSQTIKHLEKKLQIMKEIIEKQNKEISIQNEFIENLKNQFDKKTLGRQEKSLLSMCNMLDKKENESVNNLSEFNVQGLLLNQLLNWSGEPFKNPEVNSKPPDDIKYSSNSLNEISPNREVKGVVKEFMRTIIKETNPLKNSYSLEIKCSCKKDCMRPSTTCTESELMRDCSNESLAIFCRPIQKNKDNKTLEFSYSPVENGYSRNIEVLVQNNNRLKNSSSEEYNI